MAIAELMWCLQDQPPTTPTPEAVDTAIKGGFNRLAVVMKPMMGPFTVGLGRTISRIVKQIPYLSLGVVVLFLRATILGLGIAPAVLAHVGSALLLVFTALRLLSYKDRPFEPSAA